VGNRAGRMTTKRRTNFSWGVVSVQVRSVREGSKSVGGGNSIRSFLRNSRVTGKEQGEWVC